MSRRLSAVCAVVVALLAGLSLTGAPAGADTYTPPPAGTPGHDRCYVQVAHRDFLDRDATPAEVDEWLGRFAAGTHRSGLPAALAGSEEWLEVIVTDIYRFALDREPEPDGLAYWVDQLRRGAKVNRIASLVFGSAEFYGSDGTPEAYVASLYDIILGRSADQAGLGYWVGEVGRIGRSRVASSFYDSAESRNRRVTDLYWKLLDRAPEADGLAFWARQLWTVNDVRLAVELASSAEYRTGAQVSVLCSDRLRVLGAGVLPSAAVGQPYDATVTTTGGSAPRTVTATGLPAGLTMASTGRITGTVTAGTTAGPRTVTIAVTDADGARATVDRTLDVRAPITADVVAQSSSLYSSCAVVEDGAVWCWGNNDDRIAAPTGSMAVVPTQVAGISDAVDIAMGGTFVCALRGSGAVACWGNNAHGALGRGSIGGLASPTPTTVTLPQAAVQVVTGRYHACAVLADQSVRCWGYNSHGQLGTGTVSTSPSGIATPQAVAGLGKVTALAAGYFHTCALLPAGTVSCWGSNTDGQMGRTGGTQLTPTTVPGLTGVQSVSADHHSTVCVVRTGGQVVCWGRNNKGQVGVPGLPAAVTTPTVVTAAGSAAGVALGQTSTCSWTADGQVTCWGEARNLGTGSTGIDAQAPVTLPDLKAEDISIGEWGGCATVANGGISCWGRNSTGRLGDGTTVNRFVPGPVSGF